jgi:predicted PurR-regulated permease PerM
MRSKRDFPKKAIQGLGDERPIAEGSMSTRENRTLMILLVLVSLVFAFVLWPFYGAILWAVVFATVFAPTYRHLLDAMPQHRNVAALITVALVVMIVLLPLTLAVTSIAHEASNFFGRIETGEIDIGKALSQLFQRLPEWATSLLAGIGITDIGDLQARLSAAAKQGSQFLALQTIAIGQGTAHVVVTFFIMLYVLFFFLRDGRDLSQRLWDAVPLRFERKRALSNKFATVIRAMLKGALLVAVIQGFLGAIVFWLLGLPAPALWGVTMAFLSLVPVVGSALVWFPVALYLLAIGDVWKGVILVAFGSLVIGLIDNLLRPFLIGRDTNLPDYLVLVSTLGGIALFGINGLVIGPVVAAMFIATWNIFLNESRNEPQR